MNENNYKDYYEILEVHKKASQEVIKKAYTILAKKYHPDVNQHNIEDSNKRMTQLNEAYEVLSDIDKRQRYDQLHEYLGNQSINWNYRNNYDNTESRNDQYTVRTNSRSNIVKPSNISKRYNYNNNNKKLTILTYSVVVAIVAYSLITNIVM